MKKDGNITTWRHVDAIWIAHGSSAKHGKKYGWVFGKACHTFHHVFQLRNYPTTLSNIATKLSLFWHGAVDRGLSVSATSLITCLFQSLAKVALSY